MEKNKDEPQRDEKTAQVEGKTQISVDSRKSEIEEVIGKIANNLQTILLYPVAASKEAKEEAKKNILKIYTREDDVIKHLIIYMINDRISKVEDAKYVHSYEFYRKRLGDADQARVKKEVYRGMFHSNSSFDGQIELIRLLAELDGEEPIKLLNCYFTYFCSHETELARMLRNAIVEALGECTSSYGLRSLISIAKYCENENITSKAFQALSSFHERIDELKFKKEDKEEIKKELRELFGELKREKHYY